MVLLDRVLVSFYRLSVVTMSLSAVFWLQFATQIFLGGTGNFGYVGIYVNK